MAGHSSEPEFYAPVALLFNHFRLTLHRSVDADSSFLSADTWALPPDGFMGVDNQRPNLSCKKYPLMRHISAETGFYSRGRSSRSEWQGMGMPASLDAWDHYGSCAGFENKELFWKVTKILREVFSEVARDECGPDTEFTALPRRRSLRGASETQQVLDDAADTVTSRCGYDDGVRTWYDCFETEGILDLAMRVRNGNTITGKDELNLKRKHCSPHEVKDPAFISDKTIIEDEHM